MELVDEIIESLKEALETFGTYTFDDKGPDEVMDTDKITDRLSKLTAKEAGEVLKRVRETPMKGKRSEHLADYLANMLDEMPEEWFEEMLEVSGCDY